MNRKVYLAGEMEEKFGSEFSMSANSYADIIKLMECNRPGFRQYLLDCHNAGIVFTVNFAGKDIDEEELYIPIKEGDVIITPIPAGSMNDFMKVVVGIALFVLGGGTPLFAGPAFAGSGFVYAGMQMAGMYLANQGIQGMLAPDPATEEESEEGYLYTGSEKLVVEGDPVPLLYGELRVPGQPVSVALNNTSNNGNLVEEEPHPDKIIYATVGTTTAVTGPSGTPSTAGLEEHNISQSILFSFDDEFPNLR